MYPVTANSSTFSSLHFLVFQEEVFVSNGTLKSEEKSQDARFGYALAAAPDLNHDGFTDLLVGAPLEDEHRGAIYVYHGDGIYINHSYKQVLASSLQLQTRWCISEVSQTNFCFSLCLSCPHSVFRGHRFPPPCSTLAAA